MSRMDAAEPDCDPRSGSLELTINARRASVGALDVRRLLPAPERRMVGPFIFFDHFGPAEYPPGEGLQIPPHPHIGIATITWLFEGEVMHRDSLGSAQLIRPGAVNVMTAGRGIVHSERAGPDIAESSRLEGIQLWLALPDGREEMNPEFGHTPAEALPCFEHEGADIRLIMGDAFGRASPVTVYSPTLYFEARMPGGAALELPDSVSERAVYVVGGSAEIDGQAHTPGMLAVACAGQAVRVRALEDSHVMVLGGEPVGDRHIYWNFVSSSAERIERALRDWEQGRFADVPGDSGHLDSPRQN